MDEILEGQTIVPKEIVLKVEFPKAFSTAHSDLNALFAFCVRRANGLGLFSHCEGMPYAAAKLCEETGVDDYSTSPHILALLDEYFKIKEQEKEAAEAVQNDKK